MCSHRALLSVAMVVLSGSALRAEEKYTLTMSRPEKTGDRQLITKIESMKMEMTVQDSDGNVVREQKESKDKTEAFEETILAKVDGKRASKFQRRYEKIEATKNGARVNTRLAGKTVVFERANNAVQFRFDDGKELSGDALDFLQEEFKNKGDDKESKLDEAIMPKQPVAVGDSWACDVKTFILEFTKGDGRDAIDEAKAKATGKLVRVYKKDGHNFGVIESLIELPLKAIGPAPMQIPADPGSVLKINATFDGCVDGSETNGGLKSTIEMKATATLNMGNDKAATLKIVMKGNANETQKPAK